MATKLQLFFDWQIFFQTISDAPSRLGVAMVRVWVMATVGEGRWSARAVRLRLWRSGVPPARRQQGRVESRHAALRSAYRVMAECRRSATMCADVGGDGVTRPLARSGWRRCSGAGMASVEDEVRRADSLSVNPGQRPGREDDEICTAGRCRCRCSAGVCQRRRSAAHQRRLLCPRRCRGLTESVTARAVRLCHCCARR